MSERKQINLRLTPEMIAALEDARGEYSREAFIRHALCEYLGLTQEDATPDWLKQAIDRRIDQRINELKAPLLDGELAQLLEDHDD